MVLSENAMENLRKNGKVVFIDVDLDEIKRRVTNIKTIASTVVSILLSSIDTVISAYFL